jgi:predicted Zn-dependent protease
MSLAEGYRFNRKQLPAIAAGEDMEAAMREVSLWLADFGNRLQKRNSFKEAEFVQKLALGLQPDQYFTKLPLATTYYKMERYDEAAPLFKEGLAQLENCADGAAFLDRLETGANLKELSANYEEMYETCLKARGNQRDSVS